MIYLIYHFLNISIYSRKNWFHQNYTFSSCFKYYRLIITVKYLGILEEFDLLLITNISSKWYFDEIIGMIKENPLIFIPIKAIFSAMK
ncbi:hypothetical protein DRO49_04470 [Candidatus Bathyarchaeota archaeon]|nr:MAG: hypothetical protein DRO49_04470 [Candidatus Bathyarchaeota archaeon]